MNLEIEDFKKIFDNVEVEGFKYEAHNKEGFMRFGGITRGALIPIEEFCNDNTYAKLVYYPLFLQRLKQAINQQSELDVHIVQTRHYVQVLDWQHDVLETYPDTDEGLEDAILYVLGVI